MPTSRGRRARALGVLGAIDTLGWVWGPLYGAMLVRFLSWHWQFYLNWRWRLSAWWRDGGSWPSSIGRCVPSRIDWAGATYLTVALVSLNLALLGSAEIQSVTGLDELTGSGGRGLRWFYAVAAVAVVLFVRRQRTAADPIIDHRLFRGRNLSAAVAINFLVGAALVIAMVNVPLFVNVIELDVERSAVISGWVLAALTSAMAVTSYVGGRVTERTWYRPPVAVGLAAAAVAFVFMGSMWGADTTGMPILPIPSYAVMALHLALLGGGIGLVIAPTSAAVVDGAPADQRGTAAGLVIVMRLMGLSVGLSALTAWGLHRFNQLREAVELPPIGDPGFREALTAANADLTTTSLASTFSAAAIVSIVALGVTALMRRTDGTSGNQATNEHRRTAVRSRNDKEDEMKAFIVRHFAWIVAGSAAAVVLLAVSVAILFARLGGVQAELETTRGDLERVEAGAAIFASQVQAFQSELTDLAPTIGSGLDEAAAGLAQFRTSTIEFDVAIDETVPIDTQIVLDRTIEVPINTSLPIDETFNTTIVVSGPFGVDLPLDVAVPVKVDVPVDLTVAIPVNESFPISTAIPVKLDLPVRVDVAGTELAALAESLEQGLASFRGVLDGLGG